MRDTLSNDSSDFERFMQGRETVGHAYVTGDSGPLAKISAQQDPATFFSPLGGYVQGAADVLSENEDGAGHFRPGGNTQFEILHMSASGDLGYWVGVQHANVRMEGSVDAIPMHLRITEIFRRENGGWKLFHRHADPNADPPDDHDR
ncbi:MAG: YybH family protein [Acidimicrobiales bacterium]